MIGTKQTMEEILLMIGTKLMVMEIPPMIGIRQIMEAIAQLIGIRLTVMEIPLMIGTKQILEEIPLMIGIKRILEEIILIRRLMMTIMVQTHQHITTIMEPIHQHTMTKMERIPLEDTMIHITIMIQMMDLITLNMIKMVRRIIARIQLLTKLIMVHRLILPIQHIQVGDCWQMAMIPQQMILQRMIPQQMILQRMIPQQMIRVLTQINHQQMIRILTQIIHHRMTRHHIKMIPSLHFHQKFITNVSMSSLKIRLSHRSTTHMPLAMLAI